MDGDLNGDGEVEFGEGVPDANILKAAMDEFDRYANELKTSAADFEPNDSDALTALVVMTPTMSEYFEAWKNSRFIAGEKTPRPSSRPPRACRTSRTSSAGSCWSTTRSTRWLPRPIPSRPSRPAESLKDLHAFAVDLREREAKGEKFTAEQADTLGAEAQERAEAIAGQVSQAAEKLNIEIQEG